MYRSLSHDLMGCNNNPDPGAGEIAMGALKRSLEPLTPVLSAIFAGKLDPAKLSFIQRRMTEPLKSPVVTSATRTRLPDGYGSCRDDEPASGHFAIAG
jgi:hypothetical protein